MSLLLLFGSSSPVVVVNFALDAGSYSSSGSDLSMQVQRMFALDSGSYSLTGGNLEMQTIRLFQADSGIYTTTGSDLSMNVMRQFPLETQVAAGVSYGPTGTEYTGTLSASSGGGAYIRRR